MRLKLLPGSVWNLLAAPTSALCDLKGVIITAPGQTRIKAQQAHGLQINITTKQHEYIELKIVTYPTEVVGSPCLAI